jgi:hypothetical protein
MKIPLRDLALDPITRRRIKAAVHENLLALMWVYWCKHADKRNEEQANALQANAIDAADDISARVEAMLRGKRSIRIRKLDSLLLQAAKASTILVRSPNGRNAKPVGKINWILRMVQHGADKIILDILVDE